MPCRASSLVLGDLAVTRQKEFTSIAVTAHHWVSSACAQWTARWCCRAGLTGNTCWSGSSVLSRHDQVPLQEVPEAALAPWLRRQAADGWALVGLEQTAESVPLQVHGLHSQDLLNGDVVGEGLEQTAASVPLRVGAR